MFKDKIWRRLLPLYLSRFFQGLVLWYAIEKVFMVGIGFDASSIALVVMLGSVVGLLLEIPSGILADRWSRRGVLMLAYGALALGSLLFGLSDSVLEYTLASVLFAAHMALLSGVNDAIVYDTVVEETGGRAGYEKYYSYTTIFTSAGLIISSLPGGVVGDVWGLEAAYFLSVPGGVLAIISLLFLREPKLHKHAADTKLLQHTADTLRQVFRKGAVALIVISTLALGLVFDVLRYVDQLWPLALNLPVVWYGPLNALLMLGYGIGAVLAARSAGNRRLLYATAALAVLCTCLLTVANIWVIALAQLGGCAALLALLIILRGWLHDTLPSHLRSGSSSAVSTLLTLVALPLLYVFGAVTEHSSIFIASIILIPLVFVGVIGLLRVRLAVR